MANRYGRDIGRRDREGFGNEERDRSHYPRSGSGFGSSPFDEDESYFGGSRRYGQGYQGDSPRNFDTYGGGNFGRSSGGYTERDSWSGGEDDRYSQGNERSQGRGGRQGYSEESEYRGGYSRSDRPDRDYQAGTGYSGFSERGGSRGFSGPGGSGKYGGRSGSGGHGSGHEDRNRGQSSERGYTSGGYNEGDRGWLERASDEVSSWFGGDDDASHQRDMRQGGGHRGRGPSGYTRSDERIREDINDRLTDYDYLDATHINVEVQNGEVILSGTVESRYEKRLAEDIAEDCSGVRHLENRLRISQNTAAYAQQGTSTSYSADTQSISGTADAPGSITQTNATETTTGPTGTTASSSSAITGQKARGKSSSGS